MSWQPSSMVGLFLLQGFNLGEGALVLQMEAGITTIIHIGMQHSLILYSVKQFCLGSTSDPPGISYTTYYIDLNYIFSMIKDTTGLLPSQHNTRNAF